MSRRGSGKVRHGGAKHAMQVDLAMEFHHTQPEQFQLHETASRAVSDGAKTSIECSDTVARDAGAQKLSEKSVLPAAAANPSSQSGASKRSKSALAPDRHLIQGSRLALPSCDILSNLFRSIY